MGVPGGDLSTANLDYLQRPGTLAAPSSEVRWTLAPPALRRLSRIRGVGRYDKEEPPRPQAPAPGQEPPREPTEDLLVGLHTYKIPVAFVAAGDAAGVSVDVGTWEPGSQHPPAAAVLDARHAISDSIVRSLYPSVDIRSHEAAPMAPDRLPLVGVGLGVPTIKQPDPMQRTAPLDRLIAAMGADRWALLVLAQPVDEGFTIKLRQTVINETRSVQAAEQALKTPSPLSRHYAELLTELLKSLTLGHAVGTWRTAVYLFGDTASYYRLVATWRSVYAGERSIPEPIRVWETQDWPERDRRMLADWGLPDTSAPPGPGRYRHPFGHQTLLNSHQLSSYIHFPHEETSGFAITTVAKFDTEPPELAAGESAIQLGPILHRGRETAGTYAIGADSLTTHVLVAGITGSGKTNSIRRLLRAADVIPIPFLVLEPAKAEYRSLLDDGDMGARLRVFTAGNEQISPLRMNPFDVPVGTTVSQHLDLLRSVFGASFGMWTPLPQVLEQCLHEVYADYGWDLAAGTNPRIEDGNGPGPSAFPTLTDLVAKVVDVVPRLGYEDRVTSDLTAALLTRLEGLRRGGKGRMLDTRQSISTGELVAAPTVVELEWMGDDDDKAFVMALLLVRLYEHRRAEGDTRHLRHLLVIEEAHRLLAAEPQRRGEEQADPRGKAVETFSQLLSEIRAYGQGVVIADQIPVRLVPDVLKNTGLKIAHRTVAAEDRAALAGAMAMDERQARSLTTLPVFEGAVFGSGDDAPVLVRIPFSKGGVLPDHPFVAHRMGEWRERAGLKHLMRPQPFCDETCEDDHVCDVARRLAADKAVQRAFGRVVLSTLDDPTALHRLWGDLLTPLRARRPPEVDEAALLRSLAGHLSDRHASRRGAQAGWSFATTEAFATLLRRSILERLTGATAANGTLAEFREFARTLARRTGPPYPGCDAICNQADPPLCVYRHAVADEVAAGRYHAAWQTAFQTEVIDPNAEPMRSFVVAQDAAYQLIDFPEAEYPEKLRSATHASARRATLCYAQQMLAADAGLAAPTLRRFTERLVEVAGLGVPADGSADERQATAEAES